MNPLITVFTPAYNRAHTLPRTYKSLQRQKIKNFKWLVIDDGSTDHTGSLVREWQRTETSFEIDYIYKENGGMHTAHNTAYENIDTILNVCIDSDDCLAEDAIQYICDTWEIIKNDSHCAGIIALDADMQGKVIGSGFPKSLRYTTLLDYYYKYHGKGDKKLVYRTSVMKQYPPYPVFAGEKYVSLACKYVMCDQDYNLYVLPRVLCNVDYQADGSTATMWKQYLACPNGFAYSRRLDLQYIHNPKKLLTTAIHYDSTCILAGRKKFISDSPRKILTACMLPYGAALSKVVRIKGKEQQKGSY